MQPLMPSVSLQTHDLTYNTSSLSFKLSIPVVGHSASSEATIQPFTNHVQRHLDFRQSMEPDSTQSELYKKAYTDLKSIQFTFPMLTKTENILAAAACFSFQCLVDDIVEDLDFTSAVDTLEAILNILCLPHESKSRTTMKLDSGCVLLESLQAIEATIAFRNYMHALVNMTVFGAAMKDQHDIHTAMLREQTFRKIRSCDVREYLRISTATMGIHTFFTLLHHDMGILHASDTLIALETEVTTAVRLANDLVGLEKDIYKKPEWMNCAIIATANSNGAPTSVDVVESGIVKAVQAHNQATAACAELIVGMSPEEYQSACAAVGFVGRHLKWAMSAKRYKA